MTTHARRPGPEKAVGGPPVGLPAGWIAVGLVAVGLVGCSQPDVLQAPTPIASVASTCDQVMARLPEVVAGQAARGERGSYWRQWGDPAITVRCGVPAPAGLGATSRCDVINDVGWFSEQTGDGYRFTTIGRVGYVEVSVPHRYAPEADALVDLTPAVSAMPVVAPCH